MTDLNRIDEIDLYTGETIRAGDEGYMAERGMLLGELDLDALLEG